MITDELTGALSRDSFRESAERLRDQLRQHGGIAHLLLVEVDGLRVVIDTHGLEAGDDLVRRAAKAIAATIDDADLIGRWSDEELLIYTSAADVEILSRRIVAAAAGNRTTVSIGPVSFGETDRRDLNELTVAAESARYAGRQQRRLVNSPHEFPTQRGSRRAT